MAVRHLTNRDVDGTSLGYNSSDLISFYGGTTRAQPSGAAQAAITDASGGAAAPTNGVLTLTGTYNSAIIADALATVIAQSNAIRNALVSLNLIAGA